MATKKSSKQSATRRAKSAKTTKRTSSTKVSATKSKPVKANSFLGRLNLLSAVAFVVLAVLTGLLVKDAYYQITTSYLVRDELVSDAEAFLPAARNIYDLNVKWVLVVVLAASAIVPLLALTRLKRDYDKAVKDKVQVFRWIDSAVTWAGLVGLVALLSGVHDIVTIKLMAAAVAITMLLGWLSERQNKTSADRAPFMASLLTGLVVVAALGAALANTYVRGLLNLPWYTYATAAIAVVGLALWQFNHFNYLRGFRNWKNYQVVERNYLGINLATKSLIAVVLLFGLT